VVMSPSSCTVLYLQNAVDVMLFLLFGHALLCSRPAFVHKHKICALFCLSLYVFLPFCKELCRLDIRLGCSGRAAFSIAGQLRNLFRGKTKWQCMILKTFRMFDLTLACNFRWPIAKLRGMQCLNDLFTDVLRCCKGFSTLSRVYPCSTPFQHYRWCNSINRRCIGKWHIACSRQ